MPECPICSNPVATPVQGMSFSGYECPRCGRWSIGTDSSGITLLFARKIGDWDPAAIRRRSRLSHILRRQQPASKSQWTKIPIENIDSWHLEEPLPSPSEQLDELTILVGENQPSPAESATLAAPKVSAWIGATITRPPSDSWPKLAA